MARSSCLPPSSVLERRRTHRPDLDWRYKRVVIRSTSHDAGGEVTPRDIESEAAVTGRGPRGRCRPVAGAAPGCEAVKGPGVAVCRMWKAAEKSIVTACTAGARGGRTTGPRHTCGRDRRPHQGPGRCPGP